MNGLELNTGDRVKLRGSGTGTGTLMVVRTTGCGIAPAALVQWQSGPAWGNLHDLQLAPCWHGSYYDCEHGCPASAAADRTSSCDYCDGGPCGVRELSREEIAQLPCGEQDAYSEARAACRRIRA